MADGVAAAVTGEDHGRAADADGVVWVHRSGDKTVPLAGLKEYLEAADEGVQYDVLPPTRSGPLALRP